MIMVFPGFKGIYQLHLPEKYGTLTITLPRENRVGNWYGQSV